MPNSHHRPKHKQHLHHKHATEQHLHQQAKAAVKTKSAMLMAIIGAIAGFIIAYFANNESVIVWISGAAIGSLAGYFFGNSIDKALAKKQ